MKPENDPSRIGKEVVAYIIMNRRPFLDQDVELVQRLVAKALPFSRQDADYLLN